MKHYSLYELHQFIQRVFYLNFEESVWIEAEIAESRVHNGHVYLTLIQKDRSGQLIAKASCSIWRSSVVQIKKSLGSLFSQVVKTGNKVKLRCKVEFHPRYGYSLHAEEFDKEYTEGFLHLEKQKTIHRLKDEKLFDRNSELDIPLVIKRIALVSSPTAAGYQDFMHQLTENVYGYQYMIELFSSAMQGDRVQEQFTTAMAAIEKRQNEFDVIVIVRGGGASVDLSDFDDYKVAASVAKSSLPVLAGIGHERDFSVTDMVAFARVKTPTAAAETIVENNLRFEMSIKECGQKIRISATIRINDEIKEINNLKQSMLYGLTSISDAEHNRLEKMVNWIIQLSHKHVHKEQLLLVHFRSIVMENNPISIMKKGYAMVYQNQRRIKNLNNLDKTKPVDLYMNNQNITLNGK